MANLASAIAVHVHDAERRSGERIDVAIWGQMRTRDRRLFPVRIANISAGGVMMMSPAKLKDYSEVELELPVIGWRPAITVWSDGDRMGAEFEPPLNPALIHRMVELQG